MTRQDYILISNCIRMAAAGFNEPGSDDATLARRLAYLEGLSNFAIFLCNAVPEANLRFNRARFMKACGVQP